MAYLKRKRPKWSLLHKEEVVCLYRLVSKHLTIVSKSKTTRKRQDNDKTNVEPVHSYDAFHTSRCRTGVKGFIGMHRFNICLVVLLWCVMSYFSV